MKRKLFYFSFITICLLISTFLFLHNKSTNTLANIQSTNNQSTKFQTFGHAKVSFIGTDLDSLYNTSALVVQATISNVQFKIVHNRNPYVTTKIHIDKVIKGSTDYVNKDITLLQLNVVEDPIVEPTTGKLLFLNYYPGPVVKDAWVPQGLFQGIFDIDNNKIKVSDKMEPKLIEDMNKLGDIDSFIKKYNKK